MGGKAFPEGTCFPMNREQYEETLAKVRDHLNNFGLYYFSSTLQIREKETFGDVDFIVLNKYGPRCIDRLISYFTLKGFQVKSSPDQLSIAMDGRQVDLILYDDEDTADFAERYHDWNDLGGLLGVIARSQGLKLKDSGLYLRYESTDLLVTRIWDEVLTLLGFSLEDVPQHEQGFETYQGMFEWVTRSSRFTKEAFLPENRNSSQRNRDGKRKTFQMFLKFLSENVFPDRRNTPSVREQVWRTQEHVRNQAVAVKKEHLWKHYCSQRFNGNIVRELTGLEGKELGNFMATLRNSEELEALIFEGDVPEWIKREFEKGGQVA